MLVVTNICRNKSFLATNIFSSHQGSVFRDKHTFVIPKRCFAVTNTRLLREKNFRRDQKMILVAAPANDRDEVLKVFIIISNVIFRLR